MAMVQKILHGKGNLEPASQPPGLTLQIPSGALEAPPTPSMLRKGTVWEARAETQLLHHQGGGPLECHPIKTKRRGKHKKISKAISKAERADEMSPD